MIQVKISLMYSEPELWRRLLIPADIDLVSFHFVIQEAMGWEDAHLHEFQKGNTLYRYDGEIDTESPVKILHYEGMKVRDFLKRKNSKMIYLYDFGDNWQHEITHEGVLKFNGNVDIPICMDGAMNCPPEDILGIPGYNNFVAIITNPKHPEYEDLVEWQGIEFDPEYFDIKEVNKRLFKMYIKN